MPEFAAYEPDRPSAERAVPTIAPLGLAAVAVRVGASFTDVRFTVEVTVRVLR